MRSLERVRRVGAAFARRRRGQRRRRARLAAASGAAGVALFVAAVALLPLPAAKLALPESYRYFDQRGEPLGTLASPDGFRRMRVGRDRLPAAFVAALLLKEDRWFRWHPGVNPAALVRALVANVRAGRVVSGGSTLTMQLARMLDRRPRTLGAKLLEAFRALQLEWRYDKDEILALYASLAPYGGNVEGLEAAAWTYFGVPASQLGLGNAALLASVPQDPNRLRPDREPAAAAAARDRLIAAMERAGVVDADRAARARAEPVAVRPRRDDRLAIPHWAWRLRRRTPGRYEYPTTIDATMQARALRLMRAHVGSLAGYSISNAACVVIDNATREVRVAIGSLDERSTEALGANDGTWAPRSPGSTFKPWLYGLAFDAGVAAEKTVLYDIPLAIGGYAPENFAREFLGPVTVREALTESLNVVAVRLSHDLGPEKLYDLLKRGGISTLRESAAFYGLPLVLGGAEVRLVELVNLYASLADGGRYRPYRVLRDEPEGRATRLISPQAAWLVLDILTDVARPDFPASWRYARDRPEISWKTGTSYGQRDAWSIGVTPRYTIGVWLGNFDGTPSQGLVGRRAAGPLLFDLFQALLPAGERTGFPRPAGVGERTVCSVCGLPPGAACNGTTTERYLVGKHGPVERTCAIPQRLAFDKATGLPAGPATPPARRESRVFDVWPSEVASFLETHGVPVRRVPPYDPNRMAGEAYYPPKILAPAAKAIYYRAAHGDGGGADVATYAGPFAVGDAGVGGIALRGAVTNRVREVHWFVNGKLVASGAPTKEVRIDPGPGKYRIVLVDAVGGRDEVELVVRDARSIGAVP
jgi:penicillin-binding protein 1C